MTNASTDLVMGGGAGLRSRHSAPVQNNRFDNTPNVGRHYHDGQFPHLSSTTGACMCYRQCCFGSGGCLCTECSGEGHAGCTSDVAARRVRAVKQRQRKKELRAKGGY